MHDYSLTSVWNQTAGYQTLNDYINIRKSTNSQLFYLEQDWEYNACISILRKSITCSLKEQQYPIQNHREQLINGIMLLKA